MKTASEISDFILNNYTVLPGSYTTASSTVQKKNGRTKYSDEDLYSDLITVQKFKASELPYDVFSEALQQVDDVSELTAEEEEASAKPYLEESEFWDNINEIIAFKGGNCLSVIEENDFDIFCEEGANIDFESAKQITRKLYHSMRKEYIMPYPEAVMVADLPRKLEMQLRLRKAEVIDALVYDENAPAHHLGYLLQSLEVLNFEEDLKIMKHFIYLIKRAAMGHRIFNQVFPVIVGAKGVGKSVVVKRLLRPLKEFVSSLELKDISEERAIANDSANNMVLVFDEMASAEKSNMQMLKRWVTADELTVRTMGTNTRSTRVKIAQGIGTSNDDLQDILNDKTGNRRFFQITSQRAKDNKCEWIESEEYGEEAEAWYDIWRSVDENSEGYWLPSDNERILEIMSSGVSKNTLELFVDESFDWTYTYSDEEFVFKSFADLFTTYKKYVQEANIRNSYQRPNFSRKIGAVFANVDPRCKPGKGNGGTRGIMVPKKDIVGSAKGRKPSRVAI